MLSQPLQHLLRRLALFLAVSAPTTFAQTARLLHQPVKSATEGVAVQIQAEFAPSGLKVYQARVYYRTPDQTTYRFRQMVAHADGWRTTIPADQVRGSRLQYFISAAVANDAVLVYPEINPYNHPEEIIISPAQPQTMAAATERSAPAVEPPKPQSAAPSPSSTAFPELVFKQTPRDTTRSRPSPAVLPSAEEETTLSPILILTPEEGESVASSELTIAVSFVSGVAEVDSNSVKLWLDGADVTSLANVSASLLTYEPKHLKIGRHMFEVEAKATDGTGLPTAHLNFTITEEKKEETASVSKASMIQAHIFADTRYEELMEKSKSFHVGGMDITGQYKGLHFEGNLYLTSLEKKTEQPVDRYHLALYNRWLGISAGDNHPMYNDLILWGKRVRGMSGYLHLGFINLDVVSGITQRGVEGRWQSLSDSVRTSGIYQQKLFGIRPSIGSGKRFQLGLTLVKVKDDVGSIKSGRNPKDNLVLGPDLKLSFDRGRFQVEVRGAMSFLTDNIEPGAISSNSIKTAFGADEELPIDPQNFADYFIINESTTPLNPLEQTSIAYNASVKLNYFRNQLQVGYKSIGAEYQSLANAWLRKNLAGLYFSDRLRLFKNKLYATFGYEDYIDNFSRQNANPSVALKTFNYALTFYPGQQLPQLTLSLRDHHRNNGVQSFSHYVWMDGFKVDTLLVDDREKQLFRDLSVQLGYEIGLFSLQHMLTLSYMSSRNMDSYRSTRLPDAPGFELETGIFLVTLMSQFNQPLKTTLSFASTRNSGPLNTSGLDYHMLGGGAEYGFWQNRLTLLADLRRTRMSGKIANTGSFDQDQARLSVAFQIAPRHTLLLDGNLIRMQSKAPGTASGSYTDRLIRFRYDRYF